jgi:hypothetical protein
MQPALTTISRWQRTAAKLAFLLLLSVIVVALGSGTATSQSGGQGSPGASGGQPPAGAQSGRPAEKLTERELQQKIKDAETIRDEIVKQLKDADLPRAARRFVNKRLNDVRKQIRELERQLREAKRAAKSQSAKQAAPGQSPPRQRAPQRQKPLPITSESEFERSRRLWRDAEEAARRDAQKAREEMSMGGH